MGDKPQVDVEAHYRSSLVNLAQALIDAISVSQATRDIPSKGNGRQFWASVLFARMIGLGVSLQKILPGSASNKEGRHWDSTGALALCRSIFEAHMALFYLCTDQMSEDDYDLRIHLAFLHDAHERPRIMGKFGGIDQGTADDYFFESETKRIREKIRDNPVFLGLPETKRRELLKGKTPYYFSQDELLARQGEDPLILRGIWEMLSSHVHSYPFSFYRTAMQKDRGTGRENDVDKSYCGLACQQAATMVDRADQDIKALFPDVGEIARCTVDWDTLTCTPIRRGASFLFGMTKPKA